MSKFNYAVNSCPFLKGNIKPGLKALGADSGCINIADAKKLQGSIDIDKCTLAHYPNDCRWDYVIGYNENAYFVEVHPANTSNVNEVIKKGLWLGSFLKNEASDLKALNKDGVFYWIPSGKYAILKNSPQARQLAQSKIIIKNKLHLK